MRKKTKGGAPQDIRAEVRSLCEGALADMEEEIALDDMRDFVFSHLARGLSDEEEQIAEEVITSYF